MADIAFRQVKKVYGKTAVVHGVDLAVRQGELLVILGPSGCGKSTLLRMVAGLEAITSGEIAIGGKVVNQLEPRERGCAMVFQNYALYPHMTVAENIGYALKVGGMPWRMRRIRVEEVARTLGLADFLDRKPAQLSGGQRQRVAMGRAMIREPKVFLYDEPLSNLDAKLRVAMRVEIRKLHQKLGTTTLFVTHDQVEAMTLADRIVVMNKGVIEQVGTPAEVYHRPASAYVASFIGSPGMNLLPVRRAGENGGLQFACGTALPVEGQPLALPPAPEFTLGVRAEAISARVEGKGLRTRVQFTEELGSSRLLHVELGGVPVVVSSGPGDDFGAGREVVLSFEPGALHFFDQASGERVAPAV